MWIILILWILTIVFMMYIINTINAINKKFKINYQTSLNWLKNLQEGKKIEKYLLSNNIKRIVIYGNGEFGKILYKELKYSDIDICAFIDNNSRQKYYEDIPIWSLKEIDKVEKDVVIVVTPIYDYQNIYAKLRKINCIIMSLEDIIRER